ncbi:hypothetical protein [Bradyrhizobium sp. ARR65]|uniref:hypothetical protein n=1 Tax=Bradyrhizobium sp. ARR65 TaxID=1040989 RepID=UPI000A4F4DB1|nr:hypothetical protein [Bradyrhizobium sp. ARR65]
MKKFLVEEFGPDANVANVAPDTVIDFQATRRGFGVAGPLKVRAAERAKLVDLFDAAQRGDAAFRIFGSQAESSRPGARLTRD